MRLGHVREGPVEIGGTSGLNELKPHPQRLALVEFHSPFELCGFDSRVRLCRVDAHVAEHRAYRFEGVLLLENLHGDPMARSWGFSIGSTMIRP